MDHLADMIMENLDVILIISITAVIALILVVIGLVGSRSKKQISALEDISEQLKTNGTAGIQVPQYIIYPEVSGGGTSVRAPAEGREAQPRAGSRSSDILSA